MGKEIELKAQTRDKKTEKNNKIREEGFIPACIYGPGFDNMEIKVKMSDFQKAFEEAGESTLIDLKIDDQEPIKVIIKDAQRDALKDKIIHADFYKVDMNKEITTEIPLLFVGEAKAVKELGGVLVKNMDSIEVECLPGNLVEHIEVDLSSLETFDDHIKVKDLKLPEGIRVLEDEDSVVVSVSEPESAEPEEETSEEGKGGEEKQTKEEDTSKEENK